MSVGDSVFTQDARFQLHHDDGSKWTLMIKFLKEGDEGTYVCQVRQHLLFICCELSCHVFHAFAPLSANR